MLAVVQEHVVVMSHGVVEAFDIAERQASVATRNLSSSICVVSEREGGAFLQASDRTRCDAPCRVQRARKCGRLERRNGSTGRMRGCTDG